MNKHKLLIYSQMSLRIRRKLILIALIILALIAYDLATETLGDFWYLLWGAAAVVAALLVYYGLLMPKSTIQVGPRRLRLQGPLYGVNISYRRIHSVTAANIGQHYSQNNMKNSERSLVKPFYHHTCVFVELKSYPKAFRWRRFWFPRLLFGTSRKGIICQVPDWMKLSRDIESARSLRYAFNHQKRLGDARSPAARILAEDLDF